MGETTRVQLLGPVRIERDGEPVRGFRSRKALALLGYLAVQGGPVPRERLADLLWEDMPEPRGRSNLSWVLGRISSLLPGCLQADCHSVQFRRPADYWLDVHAFEELEARGDSASLAAAVDLYRGEFLEGVTPEGCAEFEIWLVGERERWRKRVAEILERLVAHHGRCGEYEAGLHFGRRLLVLEPWREGTHRQMMRLLAWSGQRGAALAQYASCRQALADELGVDPAAETTQLYEQIKAGELETPVSPPVRWPDFSVQLPSFLEGVEESVGEPTFVAREAELARLDEFLEAALAGHGQVTFVTGEAGQGKTALIQAFVRRAQAAHAEMVVAWGNGNAHTGVGDPYLPFREVLWLLTGDVEARWAAGAMEREQARRLWDMLPLTVQALVEVGPDLVGTFVPGEALLARAEALEMMTPGQAGWLPRLRELVGRGVAAPAGLGLSQSDLFEQYARVLRALARERPLMLALDDLQWVDGGSAGLLFHLGRRIEGSRVLIVGAYRPTEVGLWRDDHSTGTGQAERHPLASVVGELKHYRGEIAVDLERAEGRGFVDGFLDTEPNRLGGAFRQMLYRYTGGHPLFTVELLRGMQERGDLVQDGEGYWIEGPALDWETLPARVEAVIAERVGRLAEPSQEALRVASVEGETFTAEVVAQVLATDRQAMVKRLSGELDREHRLVRAQGLERSEAGCLSRYRFRHILFQRYLYSSLDPVERAYLHEAVGIALEGLRGEADVAPQLARHFQEAGIAEKAVEYLRQAGERAVRMSAHEEAVAHFRQALALLESLPHTPERDRMELVLQVGLVASLHIVKGYGDPELDRIYARARELCRQAGETPQLMPVLGLLTTALGNRGEQRAACEVAQQHLDLAERMGDPTSTALAHYGLGWNLAFLGEFAQSRTHLEQAVALYDPQQHRSLAFIYGHDFGVAALSTLSRVLWSLGYPDQALRRGQEALALAQELAHPFSLALAHGLVGLHHLLRRDLQRCLELFETCIHLSTEHEFPYWLTLGVCCRDFALMWQGQVEEGIAQVQQCLAQVQAVGAQGGQAFILTLLAEAYGKIGRVEEGLALLAEALETAYSKEQHWCETEIHRLRGSLLLAQGDEAGAEACFHEAIEVARRQSARSLELRATTSLCRLWQRQGRREEARQWLAAIYGWFSEGFDTPDLQEARVLAQEFGGGSGAEAT
jgi:DNA-binding SARP family transcriptional activator/tetratricopeptide (TPR) repeat protein